MRHLSRPSRQHGGFTLVELMIGMTLGLVLIGGVVGLFLQSSQSFRVDENVARMQDQARFAMDQLTRDLRMAGFVAEPLSAAAVTLDASLAIADGCGPAGEDDWLVRVLDAGTGENNTLTGVDNATGPEAAAAYGCIDSSEVRAGSDVVAIKRAAGRIVPAADLETDRTYLESTGTVALLFKEPATTPLAGPTDFREYRPQIYYIRNFGVVAGDGIPTLCRKTLGTGSPAPIETDCIAQGIEDLQISYGIDLDDDGAANQYLDDPTLTEFQTVVSARIMLLARTLTADRKYTDTRTYAVGNAPDYSPDDAFHRRIYTVTVSVRNLKNLQRLQT
jgi:prepilin-type N-terminal cleavage/methylation domain-containing protein